MLSLCILRSLTMVFFLPPKKKCSIAMLEKLMGCCSRSSILKAVVYQDFSENTWMLDILLHGAKEIYYFSLKLLCVWTWWQFSFFNISCSLKEGVHLPFLLEEVHSCSLVVSPPVYADLMKVNHWPAVPGVKGNEVSCKWLRWARILFHLHHHKFHHIQGTLLVAKIQIAQHFCLWLC